MNPDANNDNPGRSFDFDAAEQQFDDVDMPSLELSPAERQIARQITNGIDSLENGLRVIQAQVEALRSVDFEEIMRDPARAELACEFSEVAGNLHLALAPVGVAMLAGIASFALTEGGDLPESA